MANAVKDLIAESIFQAQASASEQMVRGMIDHLREQGYETTAIASGALFAVIRYHVEQIAPPTERNVLRVLLPAVGKTIRSLLAASPPKPRRTQ